MTDRQEEMLTCMFAYVSRFIHRGNAFSGMEPAPSDDELDELERLVLGDFTPVMEEGWDG